MKFDSICKNIGLNVTADVADACRYLEGRGNVFCVDFGTENAVQLAGESIIEASESHLSGVTISGLLVAGKGGEVSVTHGDFGVSLTPSEALLVAAAMVVQAHAEDPRLANAV